MKKGILLFLLLCTTVGMKAQTAEEIVAKYIDAIGGMEKVDAVKSIQMKATVDYGGMSIPLEMVTLLDGRMFVKINFQGKEITQMAFDGETLWSTNFMTMKAEKSESEDNENMKRNVGDFMSSLLQYKKNGYTIELLPEETINGTACFKIKLTKKTMLVDKNEVPNIEYYYIDKENFVPVFVESEIPSGDMKGQISQTEYSDYQEINGVFVPFSMKQGIKDQGGQTIQFTSIEFNKEFDANMFKFPG